MYHDFLNWDDGLIVAPITAPSGRSTVAENVTVVIPSKNRRMLLTRALWSALQQEHVDVSVIVVDDGSHDGTAEFVSGHPDPRVSLVRNEQSKGVSGARNAGIELVKSRWVGFLDDDDVWAPQKLRHQLQALEQSDGRKWAASATAFIDGRDRVLWIQYPMTSPIMPTLLQMNVVPGGGSGVLAETELIKEVGGFDERLSNLADWDMWLRLAQRSEPAVTMQADIGHYQHEGSMSRDIDRSRAEQAMLLEKYAHLYEQHAESVNFADWHGYLGDICLQSGRRREAVREYSRATRPDANIGRFVAKSALTLIAPDLHTWIQRRWRGRSPVPDAAVIEQWLQQHDPSCAARPASASLGDPKEPS